MFFVLILIGIPLVVVLYPSLSLVPALFSIFVSHFVGFVLNSFAFCLFFGLVKNPTTPCVFFCYCFKNESSRFCLCGEE